MADPTAGGGTEGLREALCALMWAQRHPHERLTWAEIVKIADRHPQNMGAMRVGALRKDADALIAGPLAGPLARASAEQARVEAAEANLNALARMYGEACGNLAQYRRAAVEWQGEQVDYAAAFESRVASLTAERDRLKAAPEASAYLADRYRACWLGKPVRDLAEAEGAYQSARAALREPQPTPEAPDAL